MTTHTLPPAPPEAAGTRLDRYLASHLPNISRERLKALMSEGHVQLKESPQAGTDTVPQPQPAPMTQHARKVKTGDVFTIHLPAPTGLDIPAEDIPLDILFEDAHLIVLNKPAGMSVHPAGPITTGTLVNALLHHCRGSLSGIGGIQRPGIVHRLDKGTSGVMVAAKNDAAHTALSELFAARNLTRTYLALTYAVPKPPAGKIATNIGRNPTNRKKMAVLESGGKTALTHYKTCERLAAGTALVRCKLATGRTHQIRVHMAHMRCPIIGDPAYSRRRKLNIDEADALITKLDHQMLHAATLGFIHPVTNEKLQFETPPPPDMAQLLTQLRNASGI